MGESDRAIIKPEAMRSYIWIKCTDGSAQQVEEEIAMFCPLIRTEILKTDTGSSKNFPISLPERVKPSSLSLIFDYCRYHQVPGRSNKERKTYDERFIRIETKCLCELASAADSLGLKQLVDLTSRALARLMEGKTPEQIRETFHIPDDLTEEEKLEPLKNIHDDPRIRLLNRLFAKKRKELKERQNSKDIKVGEEPKDERSVDEILSFINGDEDCKKVKGSTSKKKNKRKKQKDRQFKAGGCAASSSSTEAVQDRIIDDDIFALNGDFDDDFDPAMQEQIDREVEDFARRLNSDWPDRMQEFLIPSKFSLCSVLL